MITFASLPKPFIGHIGVIQRNAIQSWLHLNPRPQVILFGNEQGVAEIAKEFGIEHVPAVECNQWGTPLLSSVFEQLARQATGDIICYSNCDIFLFQDFVDVAMDVQKHLPQFLLLGECQNLDVKQPVDFTSLQWRENLLVQMRQNGKRRVNASDFFAFPKGMYPKTPPLTLGRAYFDNWIIWEARRAQIPVIDATGSITAIHQNHFYAAVPGETAKSHNGFEAQENLRILGRNQVYWIYDSTYQYNNNELRKKLFTATPLKERWKRVRRAVKYSIGI